MNYQYYKTMPKTFRENLRDELDYHDMKVKELSVATGIPKPTLDCYLSARQVIPPADIAVKIAKVLNVSMEYLICGDDATFWRTFRFCPMIPSKSSR